jgi:RNA polymerase sigma factor (sigma-70 family)
MDDIVHIRKCLSGHRDSFEPLVAKYKNLVYGIALNVLNNKAEAADVTQDVFLKVWASLARYDAQYSFKTWIARITVNHCININHRNKVMVAWDEEEVERITTDRGLPEDHALLKEKQEAVRKAIEELPEMYRLMVVLYHQQSLSYDEICKVTGYPLSIIKNRLYRARKMLSEKLRDYARFEREGDEGTWIAVNHGT